MKNDVIQTYKALWDEFGRADNQSEKDAIIGKLNDLASEHGDELAPILSEMASEAASRAQALVYREQFEYLSATLSMANVARTYFGKSTAWISQKINGHVKNGRPAAFTVEELKILKSALKDISQRLSDISDSL